ncbi:MAG: 30S ribosomal protein S6 [Clostridia bacterium]|nr:30S ribosomal protein S6 [Clostridia bacterium]MBR2878085.1 30S ribosomal protein S6 [Clostridia bacterium]MBR2973326.1 30S ribosomal protein S6 [Clostridia bacterium]MBR3576114.1 30S ribosomal protein S6 [Clostridia bacterium]
MTEIKRAYETIFVVDATLGEEAINGLVEKFKSLIEANAEIENVDVWGKRRLAYAIDYKTEGYYVLINFTSKTDFPAELERIYKITDGIMRSIVVVKD